MYGSSLGTNAFSINPGNLHLVNHTSISSIIFDSSSIVIY